MKRLVYLLSILAIFFTSALYAQTYVITDITTKVVHPGNSPGDLQILCKWDSPSPPDTTAWTHARFVVTFEKTAYIDKGLGILLHRIISPFQPRWMQRVDQTSIGGDASGFAADSTGDYTLVFNITDIVNEWEGGTDNNGIVLTSAEAKRPLQGGFLRIKSQRAAIRAEYY